MQQLTKKLPEQTCDIAYILKVLAYLSVFLNFVESYFYACSKKALMGKEYQGKCEIQPLQKYDF